MELAQDGRKDEAIATWQKMRAGLPEGSPWLEAVDQALARAEAPDVPVANGPSKDEMEAAAAMSPEDRASMIAGMVARLDEKLKQNPKDAEGWMQLIRSYLVIGEADKAKDALKRAVSVFGPGSEQAKEFIAFASSNGLEVAE
jgi:cytochrome c-type biogenesis protein CcmH